MRKEKFALARCIYDETVQIKIIEEGINACLKRNPFDRLPFSSFLGKVGAFFKHPLFREEREWRLVSPATSIKHPSVGFRPSRSMVNPYFSIPLGEQEKSVVNHVVVGPCPHPHLSQNSIEMFLRNKDIKKKKDELRGLDPDVRVSSVPYRNW
jgi:hypothetical protein